jgi:hypothetical protein
MRRRAFLALLLAALTAPAAAQSESGLKPGQVVYGSFLVEGTHSPIGGQFTVDEVKDEIFTGHFSGPICGTAVYSFKGRLQGDDLEVISSTRWGPIRLTARRVAPNKFAGTFAGKAPGKVELTLAGK